MADSEQPAIFYNRATVHDHDQASGAGAPRCFVIDDAELEPEHAGTRRDRFVGEFDGVLRPAKYVYDFRRLIEFAQACVTAFIKLPARLLWRKARIYRDYAKAQAS